MACPVPCDPAGGSCTGGRCVCHATACGVSCGVRLTPGMGAPECNALD